MNARASHNELRRGAAGRERLGHCFHLLSLGLGHLRTARRQTGVKMGPRRATQSARLSAGSVQTRSTGMGTRCSHGEQQHAARPGSRAARSASDGARPLAVGSIQLPWAHPSTTNRSCRARPAASRQTTRAPGTCSPFERASVTPRPVLWGGGSWVSHLRCGS